MTNNYSIELLTAARATAAAYFGGANPDDISDLNSTLITRIGLMTREMVEAQGDPLLTLAWEVANDISDLIDDQL